MSSTDMDSGPYDPARHDNQIVAVFENQAGAQRAHDALIEAGVPASAVQVVASGEGEGRGETEPAAEKHPASVGEDILGAFMSLFSSGDDHRDYAHAVGRGHAMVVVSSAAGVDRRRAIEVLEGSDPIDFDARLAEWRSSVADEPLFAQNQDRRVGRRETQEGTPRVRSYVVDRRDTK